MTLIRIKGKSLTWLLLLLGLSAVLNVIVALRASLTTDEPHHLDYGSRVIHLRPDRHLGVFADSQMPISALNALPQAIGLEFQKHPALHSIGTTIVTHFKLTRLPTILATLVLDLLVYLWAYDLYGEAGALAACLLCILSPNLMAHGTLATTDMYHAVGVVGSLFFFRRFLLEPTLRNALLCGLALALAQIAKSFAIVLYGIVGVVLLFALLKRIPGQALTARRVLAFVAIAAVCFIVVLNLAYSFDRSFRPLGNYQFETALFQRTQQLPLLAHVPVPVPVPFLQGLDMMKYSEQSGCCFGDIYLLGQLGDPRDPTFEGFKSYYVVALFYKEPIALQILFLWGIVWICRNRSLADFMRGEGLLLMAALVLFCWMSFFSRAQIGIRHILPVLAIETVIAGAAFRNFPSKSMPQKAALSGLVLWLAISVASYYPQMIPYMNEWVRDRRLAYKPLSDSNLDWGQDGYIVEAFLKQNPDVIVDPPKPVAGRILVRANRLTGVYGADSAAYLTQKYEPVAQVGYAHFLFIVPPGDAKDTTPQR